MTSIVYPRVQIIFGGHDSFREALEIDVEEFIGVKSYKAKGKRITTYAVESINELPPVRFPDESTSAEEDNEGENEEDNNDNNEETMIEDPDHGKSESDIIDEITGQMKLF